MGDVLNAKCTCGYEKEIYEGVGMASWPRLNFPFTCHDCKIVFTGNENNNAETCAVCDGENIFSYKHTSLHREPGKEDRTQGLGNAKQARTLDLMNALTAPPESLAGRCRCPSCTDFELRFETIGSWD